MKITREDKKGEEKMESGGGAAVSVVVQVYKKSFLKENFHRNCVPSD